MVRSCQRLCGCEPHLRSRRPLQIQRQQPRENLLIGQIVRPAVGGADRSVEAAVRLR